MIEATPERVAAARGRLFAACVVAVSECGALAVVEALGDALLRCLVGLYGEAMAGVVLRELGAAAPDIAGVLRLAAAPPMGRT